MIEQGLFKRHFVGRDGFQWWIGQIAPEESWKENKSGFIDETNSEQKGFGERYRVRIMGYHTANADEIPDEELPWAYVMYPVTAGSGGRGSSQSANLTQGAFVFGFFIDGEDAQLPIIMGVLGNNDYTAVMKNVTPTRFIPFDGYPLNDEVMGQQRSTLQTKNTPNPGELEIQDNAQGGQPTNAQYTSSAQGNTSIKPLNDEKSGPQGEPPEPLSQTSECEKSPMGDVQRVMMNVMNEIHSFNQLLHDANGAISAGVADVQRYIDNAIKKVTGKIAGALKWVFTEMEKFILKKILGTAKLSFSLVMPDLRETLNIATSAASDAIVCIIRNLINELPGMVSGFIGDIVGKVNDFVPNLGSPTKLVNVPRCFVEDFMATTFGNVTGLVTNAINDVMGSIDSITGAVSGLIGDVMGFVEDLISFLTCGGMSDTECPKVNEWSILSGPGSKGGKSNIQSMLGKVKDVGSSVSGVANAATGAVESLTSLGDIDFTGVLASSGRCGDLMGPRECGAPTVEYIGEGRGAEINLVVSAAGEILAGDIISAGIGFVEGQSYLKVYDDCGIGKGAIIKPVFGDVQPIPEEGYQPGIDPFTGLPTVNPGLDDNGFLLGTQGQVTLPDGSVIPAGIGTARPTTSQNLYVDPKTGQYTTNPTDGSILAVNPLTGQSQYLPTPTTGRPGDENQQVGNPIRTQSGLPGEPVESCRNVEFTVRKSASEDTAPIKLTFELAGPPPNFKGETSFSFDINQAGETVTACLYPNRDYIVTATTFRVPDRRRFRIAQEQGWSPDDPGNIKVRITDGLQKANAGGAEATFGDYPNQSDLPALQQGNGIWCDYIDTLSGKPGKAGPGDFNLGSAGPRDLQVYPNRGVFKEVNANSDNVVLFTFTADALPVLPIPSEVPTKGIVDLIVVNSGYDYLSGPNGGLGGDGATWAPPGYTVITGDPGDGTTDYYPPVPPGTTVGIPTNGLVKTPCNGPSADIIEPNGNMIEVLPCVPTLAPNGGTITSPIPNVDPGLEGLYPSTDSYPVILYLCELIVDESGMDYGPDDEIVIEPSMGATAVPKFDNFGRLISIKVTAGGEGFTERPRVFIKTETGFGANIIPKFCIDRVGVDDLDRDPTLQDKIVSVINCVGKV